MFEASSSAVLVPSDGLLTSYRICLNAAWSSAAWSSASRLSGMSWPAAHKRHSALPQTASIGALY